MSNVEQLLNNTAEIVQKYEEKAIATGERFNLFEILNVEHYENSTHSAFIATLLDRKGKHGYGNQFALAFQETLSEKTIFDFDQYEVEIEYCIGRKTKESGGRIDIVLQDKDGNRIMIENKIYAKEQKNQLLRYWNYDQKALLLFLTLDGKESEQKSAEKTNYKPISYSDFIVEWLEKCIKIAKDKPIVEEAIKQYLTLVKKLTHQNINSKMTQEIIDLIIGNGKEDNYKSFVELRKSSIDKEIYKIAVEDHLFPTIDAIAKRHNLTKCSDEKLQQLLQKKGEWWSFSFSSEELKQLNLRICFAFASKSKTKDLVFGFVYIDKKMPLSTENKEIKKDFQLMFGKLNGFSNWLCCAKYNNYRDWESLNTLSKIIYGDFKEDLQEKVEKMISYLPSKK